MKRRHVLKAVGGASGGAVAASGTAAAKHRDGAVDMPTNGDVAVRHFGSAPDVPGYTYLGSVSTDDLCFFGTKACVTTAGAANMLRYSPAGAWISAMMCGGIAGGCALKDLVQRLFGDDKVSYMHVYFSQNSGSPNYVMIPKL